MSVLASLAWPVRALEKQSWTRNVQNYVSVRWRTLEFYRATSKPSWLKAASKKDWRQPTTICKNWSFSSRMSVVVFQAILFDKNTIACILSNRIAWYFLQPQDSLPDVFIWVISSGRRVAYQRIPGRELIYSVVDEECGRHCGKVQTMFLKVN